MHGRGGNLSSAGSGLLKKDGSVTWRKETGLRIKFKGRRFSECESWGLFHRKCGAIYELRGSSLVLRERGGPVVRQKGKGNCLGTEGKGSLFGPEEGTGRNVKRKEEAAYHQKRRK